MHLLASRIGSLTRVGCSCFHPEFRFVNLKQLDISALFVRPCNECSDQYDGLKVAKVTISLKVLQVCDLVVLISILLVKHRLIKLPLDLHCSSDAVNTFFFLLHCDLFFNVLFGCHVHVELLLDLSQVTLESGVEQIHDGPWLLHNLFDWDISASLRLKVSGVARVQEPEEVNELIDVAGIRLKERVHLQEVIVEDMHQELTMAISTSHRLPEDRLEHLFAWWSKIEGCVHVFVENICVLSEHLYLVS